MSPAVRLETPRLILRTPSQADAPQVAGSWHLDADPLSLAEARQVVERMQANHRRSTPQRFYHLCLAVIHKSTGAWIGWCGLDQRSPDRDHPVIYYLLKSAYHGQGLATEAASALLQYAFNRLALPRVSGETAADNLASRRVMEKIGMHDQGLIPETGHAFTLSREEYLQRSLPDGASATMDH